MSNQNHSSDDREKKSDGGRHPRKRKPSNDKFDWRKATRTLSFWFLIIIVSWIIFRQINVSDQPELQKSYTQYRDYLESSRISSAEIIDNEFHGVLQDGGSIVTTLPFIDANMLAEWDSLKIDYQFREKTTNWLGYMISSILPWAIIFAVWIYFMRKMQGGGSRGVFSFGKSRAKLQLEDKTRVTFKDVAGCDEAKEELQEIIEFLRDPKKFSRLGGRLPKGALLLGPPGTGKTLLARAVAGEADVPFFSMSGADFVEMFVGVGAARVRDLFEQGKKNAPCIIFIDEMDAVGRHRGAGLGGGHDEREQTLNQLLVEMDGFESAEGVILIAATNRPDVLDPALTRPGRFDRQIVVDRPDVRGREGIFAVHTKKIPLASSVELSVLAKGTPGLAGADIANIVNEAALYAARRGADKVAMIDFEEAKDKVMMGVERRSLLISDTEKKQTAYHEAGHVLVAKLTPGSDPVHKVTIIPRGRALGLTHYLPIDEKHNYSKTYLNRTLTHLMGGRAAEKVIFNEFSTGAGNDIEKATEIAKKMVCEWGMSDKIGPVSLGKKSDEVFLGRDFARTRDFGEETAKTIDNEIRVIITEAEKRSEKIIRDNIQKLHNLASALLEREILDGHEIDIVLKGGKLRPFPTRKKDIQPKPQRQQTHTVSQKEPESKPEPSLSPSRMRRDLARSYGVVSSRDQQNRRLASTRKSSSATSRKTTATVTKKKPERTAKDDSGKAKTTTAGKKTTHSKTTTTRKPATGQVKPPVSTETESAKPIKTIPASDNKTANVMRLGKSKSSPKDDNPPRKPIADKKDDLSSFEIDFTSFQLSEFLSENKPISEEKADSDQKSPPSTNIPTKGATGENRTTRKTPSRRRPHARSKALIDSRGKPEKTVSKEDNKRAEPGQVNLKIDVAKDDSSLSAPLRSRSISHSDSDTTIRRPKDTPSGKDKSSDDADRRE